MPTTYLTAKCVIQHQLFLHVWPRLPAGLQRVLWEQHKKNVVKRRAGGII